MASEVTDIPGNGYCFLGSVVEVLNVNYDDPITEEQLMQKVMKFLCLNYENYTLYHAQEKEDREPTIADTLLADIIDFFADKAYNQNAADVLMKIVADVMDLDLNIYQNNGGQIQVINFSADNPKRTVNVKFTHDNANTAGNHYDAITILSKSKKNKERSGEKRNIPTFKKQSVKREVKSDDLVVIDLTDDDIPPPKLHGNTTDYNRTSSTESCLSDETYVSSDTQGNTQQTSSGYPFSDNGTSGGYPYSETEETEDIMTSENEYIDVHNGSSLTSEAFAALQGDRIAGNISRGRPFPVWLFEDKTPEEVTQIPYDIDGFSYYQINVSDHKWQRPMADRRHFKMRTTSLKGFLGEVHIYFCQGSFFCNNKECPFTKTSQFRQPNKVSWRNIRGVKEYKVCAICDKTAARVECGAHKMVKYEYSTRIAKVYHIGNHKCWPQITTDSAQLLSQVQKPVKRKGSAKEVAVEEILEFIEKGDMDGAEREADAWVDRRKVKRTIEGMKPSYRGDENSFNAVAELKKKTDEKDKYYIYQLGNVQYGNTVDHVFKSSKKMAKMAIEMDVDGEENMLQLENAYFDATHSRVQYFKSWGMWPIQPTMKKVLRLASMEICSEHHEDIALFLTLFNKILEEVTGIPGYKFNPRYFVCDESGANYKVIALVYGEEFAAKRVKGCRWHFQVRCSKTHQTCSACRPRQIC